MADVTEPEDPSPALSTSPLAQLALEDLDRLSVAELEARVAALEAEIARTRAKRAASDQVRSAADALFRRGWAYRVSRACAAHIPG